MKYHLIAIGGSAMHNLALALNENNHSITGSDDEIYNPSRDRLFKKGLLPDKMGWFPERITPDLDAVILGMHARPDNPELARAQELGLPIYSYPEFVYQQSKTKKRVVIAGSHGKTTTTAMVMYVLKRLKVDFDYLVGAQIDGFETMVRLSNAPIIVIEGDEYLSSPIDRRPKMLLYHADLAVITGIAWDHMNVFPSFENYINQFHLFIETLSDGGKGFLYGDDPVLKEIINKYPHIDLQTYEGFRMKENTIQFGGNQYPVGIFGRHNMENLKAASLICNELGISTEHFLKAVSGFTGASKRLELLINSENWIVYKDFAHAPSKVKATSEAVRQRHPEKTLISFVELHTYSSLNKAFLPQYGNTLNSAEKAIVYFDEHTLKMKKMPPLSKSFIHECFAHPNLTVCNGLDEFNSCFDSLDKTECCLLFMSSGNFGGFDWTRFE